MKRFLGLIIFLLFSASTTLTGCAYLNDFSKATSSQSKNAAKPVPKEQLQPTWMNMFKGVGDPQYSSSGVTKKDVFMFSEACVGYAMRINRDSEMAEDYMKAILGMADYAVDGWATKSVEDQNDLIVSNYLYALNLLTEEVTSGRTTWNKVGYLCTEARPVE